MRSGPKKIIIATIIGWVGYMTSGLLNMRIASDGCSFLSRFFIGGSLVSVFLLVVSFFGFGISVYTLSQSDKNEFNYNRVTICYVALTLCVAFFAVPVNGHDISFYESSGRTVNQGINVYTSIWQSADMFTCPIRSGSVDGMMYGPLTVRMFSVVAKLLPNQELFLFGWKFIMVLVAIAFLYIMKILLSEMYGKVYSSWFLWFLCTEPFIIWQWVGSGQFDGLWIIATLLAILAAHRKAWWAVWPLLTIGIWIKFLPLLITPWFVLWWWQSIACIDRARQLYSSVVGFILAIFISVFAWSGFWHGTFVFHALVLQSKWAVNSVFSTVYYSLRPLFVYLLRDNSHWFLTRLVQGILGLLVVFFVAPFIKPITLIIKRKLCWNINDYVKAIFISLLAYLMIWQKSFWPWYISWVLPFGFLLYFQDRTHIFLHSLILWLSITPLAFYILWFTALLLFPGMDPTQNIWFTGLIVICLWTLPCVWLFKWRKNNYQIE